VCPVLPVSLCCVLFVFGLCLVLPVSLCVLCLFHNLFQGYGYVTTEEIKLNPDGQVKNSGPLDYKIPGLRNIPRKLNVTLLKDSKGTKDIKHRRFTYIFI
jgi:hypothetical protein